MEVYTSFLSFLSGDIHLKQYFPSFDYGVWIVHISTRCDKPISSMLNN